MKKIYLLALITILLMKGMMAQDTLRVCANPSPFIPTINLEQVCQGGVLDAGIFAGDTFPGTANQFPPGTQGMMYVHCNSIFMQWDTSIYTIIIGEPMICVITSDSNNHAVIYVDSASLGGNNSITLKRQVTTNSWVTVTTFRPSDSLVITDNAANTLSQSYNYVLLSNDIPCSGDTVTTMHLQYNGSNLIWNAGGGVGLQGYYIYKRNGSGNFNLIDSTANLTYTDLSFQNGDEYYVEALKDGGCQSNSWRSTGAPLSVKSNRLKIGTSGISEADELVQRFYVNDATLHVKLKKEADVYLHDILGRELTHQHTDKLNIQLTPGVYVMTVGTKGYKVLIY